MKFKLSIIWAVIILLVFFVFAGCSSSNSSTTAKPNAVTQPSTVTKPNTPSSSPVVNKAPDPTPPSDPVLVKSNDSNVKIFVPTGWNTNATQLYPGSIIGVSDNSNKAYLIITEKTKASVKANSTIND
jgi:hypothetical protein